MPLQLAHWHFFYGASFLTDVLSGKGVLRTVALVCLFAGAYGIVGTATGWIGMAWLDQRIGQADAAFQLRPVFALMFVGIATTSHVIGFTWHRDRAKRWFVEYTTQRLVLVEIALAISAYGPLVGLSPMLIGRDFRPGDWDFVLTVSRLWFVCGPAAVTALMLRFLSAPR